MLIEWVSYFGIWKMISAKDSSLKDLLGSVLKEQFSSAYMRQTLGHVVSIRDHLPQAVVTPYPERAACVRQIFVYVSTDSLERDHGRLFLSSLLSPVHKMPLYSEDGKSSGSAFSEDGRGGTEPVSTIHSRPLVICFPR